MIIITDPFGNQAEECEPGESPNACFSCHQPLAGHIGGQPCVDGEAHSVGGWWNLPMARRAWLDAAGR